MKQQPKYVVHPGVVVSKTDGQYHYIGAMELMRLYGIRPDECEIYEPEPWWPQSYYRMAQEQHDGLIHLYPRYDGDYTLPTT
ncbi:hypothetical protein [Bradyrhizobium sp. BWC-3-1]|uniref:hypothetical protein n=1 Tax=Bradyrhizobium sp. BWC-3-1 TaxID=3080012 RepID=UPI00293F17F0|nr:hypothetical protein [Bradyrhizobium sp. BWC-3-1]WOH61939.1 hypothetical protein RX329_18330 [Bradyrhizobium sp. BWC-3-1]